MKNKFIAIALVMFGLVGLLLHGVPSVAEPKGVSRDVAGPDVEFAVKWNEVVATEREIAGGNAPASISLSNTSASEIKVSKISNESAVIAAPKTNTELVVERDAFPDDVNIKITKTKFRESTNGLRSAIFYVDVDVDKQPTKPVELRLSYTNADVIRVLENTLRIYYYNPEFDFWEPLSVGGVNTKENYVWAMVPHFSRYGIFGQPEKDNTTVSTSVTVLNAAPIAAAISMNPDDKPEAGIQVNKTGGDVVVSAWMTATDNNKAPDLVNGTCDWIGPSSSYMAEVVGMETTSTTTRNATCSHTFNGADESGTWTVNMTVMDDNSATDNTKKAFTYS